MFRVEKNLLNRGQQKKTKYVCDERDNILD